MKLLKILCVSVFTLTILAFLMIRTESKIAAENAGFTSNIISANSSKKLFINNCARCHGVDGRGQTELGKLYNTPDMTDAKWQSGRSNKKMLGSITNGQGSMPSFGKKLSAKDINSLVRYVRLLKK